MSLKEQNLEKNSKNKEAPITAKESCFEWIEALITSVVVVALLFAFVFRLVTVSGQSMENTILNDDKVLLTDFMYEPNNGDIVVVTRAQKFKSPIIKRVIAKSGQTLKIDFDSGDVYVDGKLLDEPYIKTPTINNEGGEIPDVVPEGYVFVMGDNRMHSSDSRSKEIGLVDVRNIMGKAQVRVYPFNRLRGLY